MNKKTIFIVIGVAFVAFIGFSLYKASRLKFIQIETKTIIRAPREEVFDMVKKLSNFPRWSPFLVQDPTQKYEVKGIDGQVGSQYHWNGNGGKDIGYQEIVKIDELNFIAKRCDISKPFVARPTFDYYFTEKVQGTEVREVFKLESSLIDAFFLWIFDAKNEMEKTNKQGLDLLNKAVTFK